MAATMPITVTWPKPGDPFGPGCIAQFSSDFVGPVTGPYFSMTLWGVDGSNNHTQNMYIHAGQLVTVNDVVIVTFGTGPTAEPAYAYNRALLSHLARQPADLEIILGGDFGEVEVAHVNVTLDTEIGLPAIIGAAMNDVLAAVTVRFKVPA